MNKCILSPAVFTEVSFVSCSILFSTTPLTTGGSQISLASLLFVQNAAQYTAFDLAVMDAVLVPVLTD
jgi:hypothetical protein